VRLERDVDSDVGSDVIPLDGGCAARIPTTGKVQVVCALAADMFVANVVEKSLGRGASLGALVPLARQVVISTGSGSGGGSGSSCCGSDTGGWCFGSRRLQLLIFHAAVEAGVCER
jgi:hypothetical protein